jgi:Family of unknown function (DUF5709)
VTGYTDPLPVESTAPDLQQPEELIGGATEDEILDSGSETADHYSVGQGYGNTAREMAQGESLDQRLAEEVPGSGTDTEADMIGSSVSDTADRSAEETAIHVVDEP